MEAELNQIQQVAAEAAQTKSLSDKIAATIHCRGEKTLYCDDASVVRGKRL